MRRSIKDAVLAREPLLGTTMTLPGATAAELVAEPFDLVWIDLEHAAIGPLDAQEMIIGTQAAGAYALVRLPIDAHQLMTMMLDAGADGVVLAGAEDPATVQAALTRTLHPPAGIRGFGPRRASLRGRHAGAAPPPPTVWAQIESAGGVQAAGEIAALPGVDALVVGSADLSFSVGTPLDTGSQQVREAVLAVRDAATAAGAAFGLAGALDGNAAELARGASIVVLGTDARLLAGAVDSAARQMRDILNHDSQEMQLS
jgi:2-keto-3-deoxy-L-rhamnonate aldolase RhmA